MPVNVNMKFQLLIISLLLSSNLLSQTDCFDFCYLEQLTDYSLEDQSSDFKSLAQEEKRIDSIQILQRIVRFDCNNEIGRKASRVLDGLVREQFNSLIGNWKLEFFGSNLGAEKANVSEEELIIRNGQIIVVKNGIEHPQDHEVLCIGLSFHNDLYLLIKLDDGIWRFTYKQNTNRYLDAFINTSQSLNGSTYFLQLMEFGPVCGSAELYYTKVK